MTCWNFEREFYGPNLLPFAFIEALTQLGCWEKSEWKHSAVCWVHAGLSDGCTSETQIRDPLPLRHNTLLFFFFNFWLYWVFVSVRGLSLAVASGGHSSSRCAGLFTIAASLVAEHRLQTRRLSSCGSWAQSLRGLWDPPRPGLEPVSPALAGGLSTTAPPGKPNSTL